MSSLRPEYWVLLGEVSCEKLRSAVVKNNRGWWLSNRSVMVFGSVCGQQSGDSCWRKGAGFFSDSNLFRMPTWASFRVPFNLNEWFPRKLSIGGRFRRSFVSSGRILSNRRGRWSGACHEACAAEPFGRWIGGVERRGEAPERNGTDPPPKGGAHTPHDRRNGTVPGDLDKILEGQTKLRRNRPEIDNFLGNLSTLAFGVSKEYWQRFTGIFSARRKLFPGEESI